MTDPSALSPEQEVERVQPDRIYIDHAVGCAWSLDRIMDEDIEYVRADLLESLFSRVAEVERERNAIEASSLSYLAERNSAREVLRKVRGVLGHDHAVEGATKRMEQLTAAESSNEALKLRVETLEAALRELMRLEDLRDSLANDPCEWRGADLARYDDYTHSKPAAMNAIRALLSQEPKQ